MSVIVELMIPSNDFDLGRRLDVPEEGQVQLETVVPLGEEFVPLVWLHAADAGSFESTLRSDPTVSSVTRLLDSEDVALFGIEWREPPTEFFGMVGDHDATVQAGHGDADGWEFELRFPTAEAISAFRSACDERDLPIDVRRVYGERDPDEPGKPEYGLTQPQREALLLAVRNGYYDIPRRETTVELAEEMGISDQAVTERLRRAITTLVEHSLLVGEETEG